MLSIYGTREIMMTFELREEGNVWQQQRWNTDIMKVGLMRELVHRLGSVIQKQTESKHVWFAGKEEKPTKDQAARLKKPIKEIARKSKDETGWVAAFETRAAAVRPTDDERRWMQIAWVRTATEAIKQAKDEKRPIFVFSVSGRDPLGRC